MTSPLSMADFVLRLAFFSLAPVAIVFAAELFPMRGALIDVGLGISKTIVLPTQAVITAQVHRRSLSRFPGG